MENKINIVITDNNGNKETLSGIEVRKTKTENTTSKNTTVTTERHFMLDDGSGYKMVMSKTTVSKD